MEDYKTMWFKLKNQLLSLASQDRKRDVLVNMAKIEIQEFTPKAEAVKSVEIPNFK